MKKWIMGGVAVLAIGGAVSGCASTDTGSTSGGSSSGSSAKSHSCGFKATDDCTPHVKTSGKVRVDALIWKVKSVSTAETLGDQEFGLGQKADGRFVIVKLGVHSDKDESATLSDNVVNLEIGGTTYDADTEGTVAAMGAGQDPFFLRDLGPDSTTSGVVVFDVPAKKLGKKWELRFNELGFGSTHGYIALPNLAA